MCVYGGLGVCVLGGLGVCVLGGVDPLNQDMISGNPQEDPAFLSIAGCPAKLARTGQSS